MMYLDNTLDAAPWPVLKNPKMTDETITIWVPPGPVVQMVAADVIHQIKYDQLARGGS